MSSLSKAGRTLVAIAASLLMSTIAISAAVGPVGGHVSLIQAPVYA